MQETIEAALRCVSYKRPGGSAMTFGANDDTSASEHASTRTPAQGGWSLPAMQAWTILSVIIVEAFSASAKESIMSEIYWTLPTALAWVLWRNPDDALKAHPNYCHSVGLEAPSLGDIVNRAVHSDTTVIPFQEARADFWEALTSGRLKALGVCERTYTEVRIKKSDWNSLTFEDIPHSILKYYALKLAGTDEIRFTNVRVPREDIAAIWPSIQADQSSKPAAPANVDRRGGRKHKIPMAFIRETVFSLMDYNGEFRADDPDWQFQADLERALNDAIGKRYGEGQKLKPTTLKTHAKVLLVEWRSVKVGN